MKWINDRNPQSPGLYAIRMRPSSELTSFVFGYFDGKGWKLPTQTDELCPYRSNPEWSVIDWGTDNER